MAICGACKALPRPANGPGFSVRKAKLPAASVAQRPKPGNVSPDAGSACQISTQASLTGSPSPSRSVPTSRILSPVAPKRVRSAQEGSSRRCQYGPIVWLLVALGMSALRPGERCRAAAAQHEIEAIAERPFRLGGREVERGDE